MCYVCRCRACRGQPRSRTPSTPSCPTLAKCSASSCSRSACSPGRSAATRPPGLRWRTPKWSKWCVPSARDASCRYPNVVIQSTSCYFFTFFFFYSWNGKNWQNRFIIFRNYSVILHGCDLCLHSAWPSKLSTGYIGSTGGHGFESLSGHNSRMSL